MIYPLWLGLFVWVCDTYSMTFHCKWLKSVWYCWYTNGPNQRDDLHIRDKKWTDVDAFCYQSIYQFHTTTMPSIFSFCSKTLHRHIAICRLWLYCAKWVSRVSELVECNRQKKRQQRKTLLNRLHQFVLYVGSFDQIKRKPTLLIFRFRVE